MPTTRARKADGSRPSGPRSVGASDADRGVLAQVAPSLLLPLDPPAVSVAYFCRNIIGRPTNIDFRETKTGVTPKLGMGPLRREQIVRATIRCLARDGYAGLTMQRVAADAAVSQGILHYYFRDKAAVLAAAALRVTADPDRRGAVQAR